MILSLTSVVKAYSFWLSFSFHSSPSSGSDTAKTTERTQGSRGGAICSSLGEWGRRLYRMDFGGMSECVLLMGGLTRYVSDSISGSYCGEEGVNVNEQEGQHCYICTPITRSV